MKIYFLYFFIFLSVLNAQKSVLNFHDSINKYYFTNSTKAKYYSTKLLKYSIKDKNKTNDLLFSYVYLANLHSFTNQSDSSKIYFKKALDLATFNQNIEQEKVVLVNELNFYINLFDYDQALKIVNKASMLSRKSNDSVTLSTLYMQKAYIFFELERYNEAIDIHLNSLKFNSENHYEYLENKLGLCRSYFKLKKFDFFKKEIDKLIFDCNKNDFLDIKIFFLIEKANYLTAIGSTKESVNIFKQIIKEADQIKINNIIVFSHLEFAKTHFIDKKYNEAIKLLNEILYRFKGKVIQNDYLAEINLLYANCYKNLNNHEKAGVYFEKFYNLSQVIGEKKINTIDGFRKIDINELKQKELESKKTKTIYLIFIILLVVLFLGFIYFKLKKDKREKIRFEALYRKIQEFENNNKAGQDNLTFGIIKTNETDEVNDEQILKIETEKLDEILINLKKIEEKKIFLKQDFSLSYLAKKLKTNTAYLSKIINAEFNKNFSSYVNDLRINYIILELKNNKKLRSFSTQAIAEEIGYKTAESFVKYFKNATGISPATYIKKINKLN